MQLLVSCYLVGVGLLVPVIAASALRRARETLVRCLSQLGLITVLAAALFAGEAGVVALGILLAGLALRELRCLSASGGPRFWIWSAPSMALPIVVAVAGGPRDAGPLLLGLWSIGVVGTVAGLWRSEPQRARPWTLPCLTLTVGAGFGAMIQLGSRLGVEHLLAAILLLQVQDSFAYLGGRRWGRHKLAPRISPGKTIEGVLAGLVAMAGFALLLRTPVLPGYTQAPPWLIAGVIPLVLVLGTGGDLLLSLAKRRAGIKDFPVVLPGHGGVLDRFDSLVGLMPALLVWTSWALRVGA